MNNVKSGELNKMMVNHPICITPTGKGGFYGFTCNGEVTKAFIIACRNDQMDNLKKIQILMRECSGTLYKDTFESGK